MNTLDKNNLNEKLKKWQEMNCAVQGICDKKISLPAKVEGLCGALPSFFVSSLVAKKISQKVIASQYGSDEDLARSLDFLAIVPTEKDVLEISQDLKSALGGARIFQMPWWGTIPYRALGKGSAVFGARAAFLAKLAQSENSPTNKIPRIFIASQRTFLSPLPNPETLKSLAINLKKRAEHRHGKSERAFIANRLHARSKSERSGRVRFARRSARHFRAVGRRGFSHRT